MYDYSGLFAIWTILTVGLVYSFLPAIRKFHALQGLMGLLWLVFTTLSAIYFQDPVIVQVFYPWILPLIYLFPALIEWHTNQTIGVPIFTRKDFVFFVMPVISALSTIVMVFAKSSPYQGNILLIMDFELLDLEQGLNSFFSAILFLSFFSMAHAAATLLRLQNVKVNHASWVFLTWPWLEGIMAFGIISYVVLDYFDISTAIFLQIVFGITTMTMMFYLFYFKWSLEQKTAEVFVSNHILYSTKNASIKYFIANLNSELALRLFAEFTKGNMSEMSNIAEKDWDAYLKEVQMSWPLFKNHMRIKYALSVLERGYLKKFTLVSLILELGFESRSSFYRVFELVTNQSFEASKYKK
jgi:hypothetical protein